MFKKAVRNEEIFQNDFRAAISRAFVISPIQPRASFVPYVIRKNIRRGTDE